MSVPLVNNNSVESINTSIIAIKKELTKNANGTESLKDVDVNVDINVAHNSLYCAANSTVLKGAPIFQGCSIKVMFTSAITGSDSSTPLVINYNDVNIPVKTGKNGTLADFVAYNTGSSFVYCQAYTTLELLFDGTQFVIMGNPVVISNADYTVYTDGRITYTKTKIDWKFYQPTEGVTTIQADVLKNATDLYIYTVCGNCFYIGFSNEVHQRLRLNPEVGYVADVEMNYDPATGTITTIVYDRQGWSLANITAKYIWYK